MVLPCILIYDICVSTIFHLFRTIIKEKRQHVFSIVIIMLCINVKLSHILSKIRYISFHSYYHFFFMYEMCHKVVLETKPDWSRINMDISQ